MGEALPFPELSALPDEVSQPTESWKEKRVTRFSSRSPDRSRCARFSLFVFDTTVAEPLRDSTRTVAVHGGAIQHHHPPPPTPPPLPHVSNFLFVLSYLLSFTCIRVILLPTQIRASTHELAFNVLTSSSTVLFSQETLLSRRVDSGSAGKIRRVSRETETLAIFLTCSLSLSLPFLPIVPRRSRKIHAKSLANCKTSLRAMSSRLCR